MSDESYKNISVALLVLTGLILFLIKKDGDKLPLMPFAALVIVLALTFMFPFVGFLLAIPIFLVIWFDNQKAIWSWWDGLKNKNLNIGGSKE